MAELINSARQRLAAGDISVGVGLRQARTVDTAKIFKTCGMDWLFIDLEHGSFDLDFTVQLSVAALDVGIAPLVRVPKGQYSMATRALDGGALGIVMPHVDDAEEAAEIVERLKYPPVGHRSIYGGLPHFDFAVSDIKAAIEILNRESLVVVMLETPDAIAEADAIAAVDGVDVVMIGSSDLTTEMGIPGKFSDPRVTAAYETVIAACKAHGKWPGMGGVRAPEDLERFIGMGMRFILAGNDLSYMMQAAKENAAFVHGLGN